MQYYFGFLKRDPILESYSPAKAFLQVPELRAPEMCGIVRAEGTTQWQLGTSRNLGTGNYKKFRLRASDYFQELMVSRLGFGD